MVEPIPYKPPPPVVPPQPPDHTHNIKKLSVNATLPTPIDSELYKLYVNEGYLDYIDLSSDDAILDLADPDDINTATPFILSLSDEPIHPHVLTKSSSIPL